MLMTVRSPSRTMITCEALLYSVVSALPTKKTQNAAACVNHPRASAATAPRTQRDHDAMTTSDEGRWRGNGPPGAAGLSRRRAAVEQRERGRPRLRMIDDGRGVAVG